MKIFVSYSRRDAGDFADQISETLKEEHDIFTDIDDIEVGDIWTNIIEDNISKCDIFIVIITFASLRSSEVEKEVLQAQKKNRRIIPCIYRGIKINQLKWNLEKFQGIEFMSKYELARDIYSKIQRQYKIPEAPASNLSVTTVPKPSETVYEDELNLTQKGDRYSSLQDYEEAVKWYDKALKSDSQYFDALDGKGTALSSLGKYEEALECYYKAARVNPSDPGILNSIGVAIGSLGKYEEAITWYDKALEIDPNYMYSLYNKALASSNLKNYEQALEWYKSS